MAERNLRNIDDNYPLLSCRDLPKKLDMTLPRSGMAKGYLPEKDSEQQKYLPSLLEERLNTLQEEHVARSRDLMQADWNPVKRIAYLVKGKGKILQSAGEIIQGTKILYPEEVLFLMEISALELHFNGAMQSIQEAYRLLLGEEMALEKFQVYSHLRRSGYIVVRHKKRSYDSSQTEHQRQADSKYDESSQELQKFSDKNEYYTNDCIDERETNSKIERKNSRRFRCLWKGIDIPNIAGKTFLDLEIPSLHLFPKNVLPQKQHYIIDLSASKTEAELAFNPEDDYNYNEYYEHNACNSSNTMNYSENQTFPSDTQNYNYTSYNVGETENYSNRNDVPSTSGENKKLDSFHNAELQQPLSNINTSYTQGYANNIYGNQNDINKHPRTNAYFNMQTRTHYVPPSQETCSFNLPYNEAGSSQIGNVCAFDNNRIPSSNYENSTASTLREECVKQETLCYETNNSLFNKFSEGSKNDNINRTSAQNYENANIVIPLSRNYRHHNESKHKDKDCYHDSSKKFLPPKDNTRKRNYSRPFKNFKNNKKRKDRQQMSEDTSLFPRINKTVAGWEEFRHETELQSTVEYLMNGPAKILWNNNITPLVAPSEHLTKENIFGALSIIKNRNDTESGSSQFPSYGKLDFDVYLPTTNYKRYDPGPPNHRIKVVRCKDSTPTLGYEDKIPVHYAIVDNGIITFYSFCNVNLPSNL